MIKAILIDIEGTTSPISFVKEVLFPYSKQKLQTYLKENLDKKHVQTIIQSIKEEIGRDLSIAEIVNILKDWIDKDQKITPLKELQGLIWEEGFKTGTLKAPIYKDAYEKMKEWKQKGYKLYIYSSGSTKAQKLFFSHTEYGDILSLFDGHFDTKIGNKKDPNSYKKISKEIGLKPEEILFLSDNPQEIEASAKAGMKAIRIVRKNDATWLEDFAYPQTNSFKHINPQNY
ncbi:MAG: acireductone synthase [Aquificae bacterium]|nr:acireductone synthase [Aquificota bacterium]